MKWILNDEKGFTLLEALISLMVTSMIVILLSSGVIQAQRIKESLVSDADSLTDAGGIITEDRQIEWHLFLNQLEYNLKDSISPIVNSYELRIDEWDREEERYYVVDYRQPKEVRRNFLRYKNNGNTRILNNVYIPRFIRDEGWLELDFSFRNGESYQGRMWIESWIVPKVPIEDD